MHHGNLNSLGHWPEQRNCPSRTLARQGIDHGTGVLARVYAGHECMLATCNTEHPLTQVIQALFLTYLWCWSRSVKGAGCPTSIPSAARKRPDAPILPVPRQLCGCTSSVLILSLARPIVDADEAARRLSNTRPHLILLGAVSHVSMDVLTGPAARSCTRRARTGQNRNFKI